MYKKEIKIFLELSKIYEDLGDEIRATAYHNLAVKLKLNKFDELTEKSKNKIEEIKKTNKLKILEDLKKSKNIERRLNLVKIIGVGPKLAEKLVKNKIYTFESFKKNYKDKTKLQEIGVKYYDKLKKKPSGETVHSLISFLMRNLKIIKSLNLAGSFRTEKKDPNDIDLIITTSKGEIKLILEFLEEAKILKDYVKSGKEDILGVIYFQNNYYRIDIKVTKEKYLATYLLYFGSGKYFSKYIRGEAKKKGYKLNQFGLENLKTKKIKTFQKERSVFNVLNIPYYTPKERRELF